MIHRRRVAKLLARPCASVRLKMTGQSRSRLRTDRIGKQDIEYSQTAIQNFVSSAGAGPRPPLLDHMA